MKITLILSVSPSALHFSAYSYPHPPNQQLLFCSRRRINETVVIADGLATPDKNDSNNNSNNNKKKQEGLDLSPTTSE